MNVRAHVFISGRVQGVFFRSEVRGEARRHNVAGWVCNLPDGRVEAVFEGVKCDVEKLVEFCRRGPPAAKVTNLGVKWENYIGEFKAFEIKYQY